jgi:urease accessory protein
MATSRAPRMITGTDPTAAANSGPAKSGQDAALLDLIWLASPALPVGGFSYSEGLEAAVDAGLVCNGEQAGDWLADQLHLTLARADLAVLAQALPAWHDIHLGRLTALNDWVLQTRETQELRLQTEQMGRSLIEWLRSVRPHDAARAQALGHLTYPVAFALAAGNAYAAGTAPRTIALAYAFGWAENMMQAAIKSIPLGQSAGQRILARLAADIPDAVDRAIALGDDDRQSFSPMLAVLSARHEHQYSRLFRS